MKAPRQGSVLVMAMPVIDGLLVALSGWLAYWLRWQDWVPSQGYLLAIAIGTALAAIIFPLTGAYQSWRGLPQWHRLSHALPGLCLTAMAMALVGTLGKSSAEFSRLWMGYWFLLALFSLGLSRWALIRIGESGLWGAPAPRSLLLLGDGALARHVASRIAGEPHCGFEVRGVISNREGPVATEGGLPVLGTMSGLRQVIEASQGAIDEIWVACELASSQHEQSVLDVLRETPLVVRYVPDLTTLSLLNQVPDEVAGVTVVSLNASPLDGYNALLKSAFDKLFALSVLLLSAPLLFLCALAIKLDSRGPVLFTQPRLGWDGRVIQVLKFRSMVVAAAHDASAPQAVRDDPRVTRVGRVLRRTSLDEMPQFWNVLRGEMSVVGPRPHPLALNRQFVGQIDTYMQRHRVKPGITGWAQVNGLRGETDTLEKMQRRVEYDLFYIQHWSLLLDLKIILRTLLGGWGGERAY